MNSVYAHWAISEESVRGWQFYKGFFVCDTNNFYFYYVSCLNTDFVCKVTNITQCIATVFRKLLIIHSPATSAIWRSVRTAANYIAKTNFKNACTNNSIISNYHLVYTLEL